MIDMDYSFADLQRIIFEQVQKDLRERHQAENGKEQIREDLSCSTKSKE